MATGRRLVDHPAATSGLHEFYYSDYSKRYWERLYSSPYQGNMFRQGNLIYENFMHFDERVIKPEMYWDMITVRRNMGKQPLQKFNQMLQKQSPTLTNEKIETIFGVCIAHQLQPTGSCFVGNHL
jgi:hypothetical protein